MMNLQHDCVNSQLATNRTTDSNDIIILIIIRSNPVLYVETDIEN